MIDELEKPIYSFAGLLLIVLSALAGPADDFKAANALYDAGKFTDAIKAYERISPKIGGGVFQSRQCLFPRQPVGQGGVEF